MWPFSSLLADEEMVNCLCVQGNYDQYVQTRIELEENQMKKYNWEQDQIAHMKVPCSLVHAAMMCASVSVNVFGHCETQNDNIM